MFIKCILCFRCNKVHISDFLNYVLIVLHAATKACECCIWLSTYKLLSIFNCSYLNLYSWSNDAYWLFFLIPFDFMSIYYILQGTFMESGKDLATFRRTVSLFLFRVVGRHTMSTGWRENLIMPMVEQSTALHTYHITEGGTTRGAQQKSTLYVRNQSEHHVQYRVVDNASRHVWNWGMLWLNVQWCTHFGYFWIHSDTQNDVNALQ